MKNNLKIVGVFFKEVKKISVVNVDIEKKNLTLKSKTKEEKQNGNK